jgi:hypothetical protein
MDNGSDIEWKDLHITIEHNSIKGFLGKFIKKGFGLMWIHPEKEKDIVYLAINNDDSLYQIPFIREGDSLILDLKYLPIFHLEIKECIEESILEYRGSGLLNSFNGNTIDSFEYKSGTLYKVKEIDTDGNLLEDKVINKDYNNKLLANTLYLEINYYLTELHQYIELKDKKKVSETKKYLKQLTEQYNYYQS